MSFRRANQEEISQIKKCNHFFIKAHRYEEKEEGIEEVYEVIASDDAFHSKDGWIVPIDLFIQDVGSETYFTEKSTYITSDRIVVPENNENTKSYTKEKDEIIALLEKHRTSYGEPIMNYEIKN